jgi:hypothetical protein
MHFKITAATIATTAMLLAPAAASAFDQPYFPYQPGDPQLNGCPSGYEALNVTILSAAGYHVAVIVDSPANGGNGDGIICGNPVSAGEMAARFAGENVPIIFSFRDNNLEPFAG